jgi:hypothetical protein
MMCGCWPRYCATSSRERSSATARTLRAGRERRHRGLVVLGTDEVVEQDAVADLARHLHHLHAGGADVDGDALRRAVAVDDVDLDVVEVHELPVEGDVLHREQPACGLDSLAHAEERTSAVDADLRRQRLPPRADAELDPSRREVVQRRERRREQADVARPRVDDAGADADPLGDGGERRHRHRRLAHEAALGLPHGLEAGALCEDGVLHAVPNRMLVLEIERDAFHQEPPFGS